MIRPIIHRLVSTFLEGSGRIVIQWGKVRMLLLGEDIILIDFIYVVDGSQGSFIIIILIILKRCKLSLLQILFILGIKY